MFGWLVHLNVNILGMGGKDELSDAILGGASDLMSDIHDQLVKIYDTKDEDKVTREMVFVYFNCATTVIGRSGVEEYASVYLFPKLLGLLQ